MSDWPTVMATLAAGWPGEFTKADRAGYALLLEDEDPAAVLAALKRLAKRGGTFRPSAAEIAGELRLDPSRPTFDEAARIVWRALRTRPDVAALDRAREAHPLVAEFMEAVGVDRLRRLPVNDPEYGQLAMRDLHEAWDRFERRAEQRLSHGLPVGAGAARRELRRLNVAGLIGPAEMVEGSER